MPLWKALNTLESNRKNIQALSLKLPGILLVNATVDTLRPTKQLKPVTNNCRIEQNNQPVLIRGPRQLLSRREEREREKTPYLRRLWAAVTNHADARVSILPKCVWGS